MSLSDRIAAIRARPSVAARFARDERRWAWRKSSILAGQIISDQLQAVVPCVVRDLSATGARLTLHADRRSTLGSAAGLPPTFKMVIEHDGVEVDCALQWAGETEAGVRFLSALRPLPKKPVRRVGRR